MAVEERQAAGSVPLEIPFDAPARVRELLARLARTEDVRLSPSGRRVAIGGFANRRVDLWRVAAPLRAALELARVAKQRLTDR